MSMIGKTLGSFECTALLGKGGMGEVYRAKDQKLGRDVAIKVLPEEFAKDTDRVARFQREAKLLASLNHPNIAAIYGLEESDGTNFLVLELIEGDTLADRLKRGAIPVEESLKLALQIAEALEAAHEKGVIHRDLKPANIKITPDGKVKVLDFGVAKAFSGDQSDMNLSNSPTLSVAATRQGVILGTAAYMSPEQARGETVDQKADIWAFGAVLFEMLTGRQMFSEGTVSDTLASVLKTEPDWQSLPPNLHPRIRFQLERCLEKDSGNRYGSIRDARVEMQKVLTDPMGVLSQPSGLTESRTGLKNSLPWIAATLILAAILAGAAFWIFHPAPEKPLITRFAIEMTGQPDANSAIALSPDGRHIVYEANNQLYMHALDQMEPTVIQGSEEGRQPFFSPDGESIAFFTPTELKTVALTGVAPVVLARVGEGSNSGLVGTWDSQDRIFFGQSGPFGLSQVSASGGTPVPFAELGDHSDFDYPDVLPGGEWVLFTDMPESGQWSNAHIVAQSVSTGERRVLLEGGFFARYVPTGHLVYVQSGTLFAVGFDAQKVEVVGKPVPIIQGIAAEEAGGHAQYAFAADGTLIYASEANMANRILAWIDRDGKEKPLSASPNSYGNPRISPDGTRVALNINNEGNYDIHIWDLAREIMTKLTFDEAVDNIPLWTPDGKRIIFNSNRDGTIRVYWKSADGTGKAEPLGAGSNQIVLTSSLSGDGKTLAMMTYGGASDIGVMSMEGNQEWKPLLQEKYAETQPQISPDGRWLSYMSNESGQFEIYVRPFPNVNEGKWQISANGGTEPRWSRDGKVLYYRSENTIMGTIVKTEPSFNFEIPEILFSEVRNISLMHIYTSWDISPDGKRILTVKDAPSDASAQGVSQPKINVVLNWFEELKERVPIP